MTTNVDGSGLAEKPNAHERKITICTTVAWICVVAGVLAAVPGAWVLSHEVHGNFSQVSLNHLSALGSYLQGAVQSLWSLAAFLFIYVAFLGQKQQLILQSEQLKAQNRQFEEERESQKQLFQQQHDEMEAQQKQFEVQQQSAKRQTFENQFFYLLNMQNQIASQMRQSRNNEVVEGRGCFWIWYNSLRNQYAVRRNGQPVSNEVSYEIMEKAYMEWWKTHQEDLGHYFRTLYHLVKFVKLSDVVVEYADKRRYTSLVRAQLSAYELALLFYNGLSTFGEGFKPWIEEFGLLEHLDRENLLFDRRFESLYDPKAFQ